jgi:hypothetical protein
LHRQPFCTHIFENRIDLSALQTNRPSFIKIGTNLYGFVQAHALLKLKKSGF